VGERCGSMHLGIFSADFLGKAGGNAMQVPSESHQYGIGMNRCQIAASSRSAHQLSSGT